MQRDDDAVERLDERVRELGADIIERRLEGGQRGGLVVQREDELGKHAVVDAGVVEDLGGDLAHEREQLELVDLVGLAHAGQWRDEAGKVWW